MTDSNLIEQAKLGDPQAIETLMNQSLQSRGMRAVVARQGDSLEVVLEAERIPNRQALTAFVQKGMANLDIQSIRSIRILGQQIGAGYPAWMQELQLEPSQPLPDAASLNIQPETAATSTTAEYPTEMPLETRLDSATDPMNELGALWAEQSTEETPDFLQELLSTDAESTTELAEPPNGEPSNDEGLIDFLNELSGTPDTDFSSQGETYPSEATQDLSVFADESSPVPHEADFQALLAETPQNDWSDRSNSSELWTDSADFSADFSDQGSVTPAGEPDADLLDFLDEAAPDAQTLDLSNSADFSTLFDDSETASRSSLPADEITSTFLSQSSDPLPAADMPPPSLDNPLLNSQIDDLFAAEPTGEAELFTEELLSEQPPEAGEDLLQALVSGPTESATPSFDELTERDPWMEGTEDVVLGMPEQPPAAPATETEELLPDFLRQPSPELELVLEETPLTAEPPPEPEPTFQPETWEPTSESTETSPEWSQSSEIPEPLAEPTADFAINEPIAEPTAEPIGSNATADFSDQEPIPWQPWQPWQNTESTEEAAAPTDIPASDLTADDFSLDPRPDSPDFSDQTAASDVPPQVEPPQPSDFAWSGEFADSEVEVEEIPPDFLLDWQDEFLPEATEPSLPPQSTEVVSTGALDFPAAPADPEASMLDQSIPDPSTELPSLESELAALDLTTSSPEFTEVNAEFNPELDTELDTINSSALESNDFAELRLDLPDSPDAELAELLSATPEGTAVEPPADWLAEASQPTDFPEELFAEPSATEGNSETAEPVNLSADQSVAPAPLPDLSQETLEAGLGEFRADFDEPLPPEFYQPDTDVQEPLNLDVDESEADYIIEDSTPAEEYTPPPLPPQPQSGQPQPAAESSGPPWLFPLVLGLVCVLFAAIGFFVFWSRVRAPLNPPPTSDPPEPPAAEPTAPAAPTSPSSANPASPTANNPANDPANALKLAFERGATAVTLSQAAQSVDDWRLVASKWQQAIDLLQLVPASSPSYPAAQQKLAEYRSYLTVAQQKAKQPIVAAVPLGSANIRTPAAAQAAISCSPVASTPDSQPIELSKVQFDPTADQTKASPLVGCITNHTEQPIAAVDVAYSSSATDNPDNEATTEASGKLNFSKLDPKQTVPFKSAFTIAPNIGKVTIASISWTGTGTNAAQQLPVSVSVERPEKQEGEA
ncbi:MAG: hypothetical protein EDM05_64765 [Leptolyngbya sp. IPPAS B-1204]|nr:MAG: hypothetical protein EDM05_12340 [Leptolyngbya sp. IPPAS B-1204]